MKRFLVAAALIFSVGPTFAQGKGLEEARTRWLKGNYAEARELYQELIKDEKLNVQAAMGLSRAWQSEGEYDKARAVIDDALKKNADHADLTARRGELLYLRGRWDEAEKAADAAIKKKEGQLLARWVRAQIYRDRGDFKKADAEFRWMVRFYNANDIDSPDDYLVIGLAGCENARWNNLADQFQFIVTDIYGEAAKLDKNYWPALYESGVLLLEKYNRAEALPAFEKALVINPRAAEVFVGKGLAALQKLEIKDAELFAERALGINPNLLSALALRADVHFTSGQVSKALTELDKARKINPRDEGVLGRIAACLVLQDKQDEFKKIIAEVEKHNPKPGEFYFILADRLEDRRRFADAEKYLLKSLELRPIVPWPRNSLGMLYMRMGREKEARATLDKAFEADAFNVRVSNMLKVLRHLDNYKTLETEHFLLRYDAETDAHLARYMSRYLEDIHAELAKNFDYQPKGKILVEVFNNHEMFSGRTVALPDLHTIGACTGRVVAMVSPRGRGIRKPFNWNRVLRHELVHIFNLEQTNFLVPHWFTEGLAVTSEGNPRPQEWNELLLARVPANDLLNLDTIDLGFIRPRSASEWNLAYCQAQLYIEYMTKKYGQAAIGGMLAAYADGLGTPSALQKVCKVTKGDFEKGYRDYLKKLVGSLKGRAAEKELTFRELRAAHEKKPEDVDLAARLAEMYLRRDKAQARKLADQVLKSKPGHPLASYVKATLLRAAGDDEQARKLLEQAAVVDPPEPKVLLLLGKMHFDLAEFAKAAAIFERARKAQPHEARWLNELVRVYAQSGDKDKLISVLKDLCPTDPDDLDARKRVARLLLDEEKFADAEKFARQALEIDVLDLEAEEMLGDSLVAQRKHKEAVEPYEVAAALHLEAGKLGSSDETRLKLARALLNAGDKKRARAEVKTILDRNADDAEAKKLAKELEE